MLSVEAWTTIRYLAAQGMGIRAICRELSVSRKAVRRALRTEGVPKYERPSRPNPKLAPYEAQIRETARLIAESALAGLFGEAIPRNLTRVHTAIGAGD